MPLCQRKLPYSSIKRGGGGLRPSWESLLRRVEAPTTRKEKLARKFLLLLDSHFRQEHGLRFYSKALCVSNVYLSEVCRDALGLSAKKCLDARRLAEAFLWLNKEECSVKRIALECGFDDPLYFSRFFKKQTGHSPTRWKTRNKKPRFVHVEP